MLSAKQQTLEEFVAECETPYLLLIRIDDPNSELAVGLAAQEPRQQGRDGLGFRTVQRNISSVIESLEAAKRVKERMAESKTLQQKLADRASPVGLAPDMVTGICHVLPLRKRSEAAFLCSISVGRARNHDIVLRHRSVSKFHGSFELDDQGHVFVRDANSSNHTFVNGRQVSERVEIRPGDNVQFGSVETHLCTAEDFWRTLND
ncbi:MAG TPA: FHA domain-containing protein [Polyangiaceae bacterium]|nr:FHA domain-containing protein [Polyangiaceae bacterium]